MSLYCFNKNSVTNFPEHTTSSSLINISKNDCITKCRNIKDCIGLNYSSNLGIQGEDSVCDIFQNNKININKEAISLSNLKVKKKEQNSFCLHSKTFNNSGLILTKFTNLVNEKSSPDKIERLKFSI